jgi:hypothetical protein
MQYTIPPREYVAKLLLSSRAHARLGDLETAALLLYAAVTYCDRPTSHVAYGWSHRNEQATVYQVMRCIAMLVRKYGLSTGEIIPTYSNAPIYSRSRIHPKQHGGEFPHMGYNANTYTGKEA